MSSRGISARGPALLVPVGRNVGQPSARSARRLRGPGSGKSAPGAAAFRRGGASPLPRPAPRSPSSSPAPRRREGAPLAMPGPRLLWEVIGEHKGLRPNNSSPSPPKSGLRIRGARTPLASTPLASTPPQAGHVQKPAAPATGPGQRGKLTAVANGLGAQLAGFLPRSPGGEATKCTSRPRGAVATARAKGLPSRGEDRARGAGSGRLPWRLAMPTPQPVCGPGSDARSASRRGGRARRQAPRGGGCALGEGAGTRSRAGGRLASGPVCAPPRRLSGCPSRVRPAAARRL